jgi:dephospho-CoA kinase
MKKPIRTKSTHARRIALTGGIASGKSLCLATFARLGVPIIDGDQLARDAVALGSAGLAAVVRRFGPSVLLPSGQLNRAALGAVIFADPTARQDIEKIIHPQVYAAVARWFTALTAPAGVADIPLLFETGHQDDFDVVVVAACQPEQQLARLMARGGLSEANAKARIAAQWPLARKIAKAHYVIDTSGTLAQTTENAEAVWSNLQSGI